MTVTRDQILDTLRRIAIPDGGDLVSADLIRAVQVQDGRVQFVVSAQASLEFGQDVARAATRYQPSWTV